MPSLLTKEQRQSLGMLLGGTLPATLLGFLAGPQTASAAEIINAANQGRAHVTTVASSFEAEQTDSILATVEQQAAGYYLVRGNLNIRSGPGTGYGIIGRYSYGDTISASSITEATSAGGYTWLRGPKGWFAETSIVRLVSSGSAQSEGSSGQYAAPARETAGSAYIVNEGSSAVFIMDRNWNQVGTFAPGSRLPIIGQDAYWWYVSGGYVLKSSPGVSPASAPRTVETTNTPVTGSAKMVEWFNSGRTNITSAPVVRYLGGNKLELSNQQYSATIMLVTGYTAQGSSYLVSVRYPNGATGSVVIPQNIWRSVRWVNNSSSGPGWISEETGVNVVYPSSLSGVIGWDAATQTFVQ